MTLNNFKQLLEGIGWRITIYDPEKGEYILINNKGTVVENIIITKDAIMVTDHIDPHQARLYINIYFQGASFDYIEKGFEIRHCGCLLTFCNDI
jgi:hypothetical protein